MKPSTINKLYQDALESAKEKASEERYDEIEVVFVPVVVCKKNGKVSNITGIDHSIIFEEENNQE